MGTADDWIAKYLEIVDRGVHMIPYARVRNWKDFFLNPTATLPKSIDGIGDRMKDLYVSNAVELLIGLMGAVPAFLLLALTGNIISIGLVAGLIVLGFVVGPPIAFLYSLLEYVVARFLGGTGDMRANFNASVLPTLGLFIIFLPLTVAQVPIAWLSSIPIISICGSVLSIPFSGAAFIGWLYTMYLKFLGFRMVHKLDDLRAVAVVVVPVILLLMLLVIALVTIYAMAAVAFMGLITAMQGAQAGNVLLPS